MFVEQDVREALGLAFNPDPQNVMSALLRDGGVQPPSFSVLPRCMDWFVQLANALSGYWTTGDFPASAQQESAAQLAGALHASIAPAVFAIIAPQAQTPSCAARDLPARCKKLVEQELPSFCARVVARWRDGALPSTVRGDF